MKSIGTYTLLIWALLLILMLITGCSPDKGDTGEPGQTVVGPVGPPGAPGNDGKDGQDANPVTMLQLCPGTTTYPSVFVEYAICLQNQLYAVYSTHGGFLALLPPGAYHSNAVGSSCNFTVIPGCGIVH